jgi:tryptophan halogenase
MSLLTMLMRAKRGPILEQSGGALSLLPNAMLAYHLENRSFVALLAKHAQRVGIRYEDAIVTGAMRATERCRFDGEVGIDALELEGGATRTFDLYVDCTGFRSKLLEGTLGASFVDYAATLYCDTAIAADMPHTDGTGAYTLAESMDHGWCWGIPVRDELHRGYVFSSAFATVDEAEAEMHRKNPTMGEGRVVRFRSGRHDVMWKANVVGVGNAYAFVEPLESTALHMVIMEVQRVIGAVRQTRRGEDPRVGEINADMAGHWDYLRAFLGLHYRFNRKFDTPFWKECRAHVDIAGVEDAVDEFRRLGPFTARMEYERTTIDPTFGIIGLDSMLLGQAVAAPRVPPRYDRAAWDAWVGQARQVVDTAVPQLDGLDLVDRHPEWLDEFVHGEHSWMPTLATFADTLESRGTFQFDRTLQN